MTRFSSRFRDACRHLAGPVLGLVLLVATLAVPGVWACAAAAADGVSGAGATPGAAPGDRPHPRTRVVILGSGTPNADPERSGPCVAIVVDDRPYLVDAGPGLVRRAAAAARGGVTGLSVERLDRVFLTHLHSDHTLGLPDLLFTPWVLERSAPLEVYGPAGTAAMVDHIARAWEADVEIRLHGGEPANTTGWRARATEIEAGTVYQDSLVTVIAFPVRHGTWRQAFGYRFNTPDYSIVLSGDTAPCDSLVAAARGADLLIHEVYSDSGFARRPPLWRRYHSQFHTGAADLGALARRAGVPRLVLYHQLLWGVPEEELVKEVEATFGGPVISAHDLDAF